MTRHRSPRTVEPRTPRSSLGAALLVILALVLTVPLLVPPPRPVLAQPVGASPLPSPSPSPGGAGPAVSPAPSASPSAAPSPSPAPSGLPQGPSAEEKRINAIVERMDHLNPTLKDYSVDLAIALSIKAGILRVPMDLEGTCYYKHPDRYRVELKNAPALLQKYPQIFGYQPVDPTQFTVSIRPDEVLDGRACWVLRLDKKSATSDFRGQTLWVDQQDYTSPRRSYDYTNQGRIDVRFKWRREQGFLLIDQAEGVLDFPKFGASANLVARYTGYRINQGVSDRVFDAARK